MPMNASEMLRRLADIIDGMSNEQSPGGSNTVINQPKANMQPVEVDATDHTDSATMVSPLQQGFEMMKIATGGAESGAEAPNAPEHEHTEEEMCEHCGKATCECNDNTPMEGEEDEVSIMRRNAGMQAKQDNAQGAEAAKDAAGVAEAEPAQPEEKKHKWIKDEPEEKTDESVYESQLNAMRLIAGLRQLDVE